MEFLKNIEVQERQMFMYLFNVKLVQNILAKFKYKNMFSYLCKVAEVSKSGYYNYLKSQPTLNV